MDSLPSPNPNSAFRTGKPAACSLAAGCCQVIRSTPFACEPRCATTPFTVDGKFLPVRRRTGGLLLVACLGSTFLAACATSPGVVSTEARARTPVTDSSTPAVDTSAPSTPSSEVEPDETAPPGETTVPIDTTDDGIGDELFPSLGNPGIDVEHYTVELNYDPKLITMSATVHLDIVMTEDRDEFSLDSDGPEVATVSIDGVPAEFDAAAPELLITPASQLTQGQRIGVDVTYSLSPKPVHSDAGEPVGWFPSISGSYVLNEPEGAHTWLPSDDHPSDKATFRFELTVPAGVTAVANGALVEHTSTDVSDTWVWEESQPMATYLIQVLTGDYEIVEDTGPNGLPLVSVVLRQDRETMQPYLDSIDEQIDYFDDYFGRYPLDRYGIAITDSFPGLAMETMGRPIFSRRDFASGRLDGQQHLLPLARTRPPMVRRCGHACPMERHLAQRELRDVRRMDVARSRRTARRSTARRTPGWQPATPDSTADPTVDEMFTINSYDGGAVILHALRKTIGDDLFFTLLRRWVSRQQRRRRARPRTSSRWPARWPGRT